LFLKFYFSRLQGYTKQSHSKIAILLRFNTEVLKTQGYYKNEKIALAFGLARFNNFANAADALNGTVWKTIDDETKKPKAIVKFTEQKNGTLSASIQNI
jgi:hypothetical protein